MAGYCVTTIPDSTSLKQFCGFQAAAALNAIQIAERLH
jgi:hypothetical protein